MVPFIREWTEQCNTSTFQLYAVVWHSGHFTATKLNFVDIIIQLITNAASNANVFLFVPIVRGVVETSH